MLERCAHQHDAVMHEASSDLPLLTTSESLPIIASVAQGHSLHVLLCLCMKLKLSINSGFQALAKMLEDSFFKVRDNSRQLL